MRDCVQMDLWHIDRVWSWICAERNISHIFLWLLETFQILIAWFTAFALKNAKKFKKLSLWNFWLPWKFIMEIFHIPNINKIGKVHQKRISKIYFIFHEKFLFWRSLTWGTFFHRTCIEIIFFEDSSLDVFQHTKQQRERK